MEGFDKFVADMRARGVLIEESEMIRLKIFYFAGFNDGVDHFLKGLTKDQEVKNGPVEGDRHSVPPEAVEGRISPMAG